MPGNRAYEVYMRILARLETIRDDLKRGMKTSAPPVTP